MKFQVLFTKLLVVLFVTPLSASATLGASGQDALAAPEANRTAANHQRKFLASQDVKFNVLQFGDVTGNDLEYLDYEILEEKGVEMSVPQGSDFVVLDERIDADGKNLMKVLINGSIYAWVLTDELSASNFISEVRVSGKMIVPVNGRITSRAGMRRHPISRRMKYHAGTDIAASKGTPVKAAAAGTVAFAGWAGGYGKAVYLVHAGRVQTRYAHMSQIKVRAGQQLAQGQIVGLVGSTGRSTGPHLHFETKTL